MPPCVVVVVALVGLAVAVYPNAALQLLTVLLPAPAPFLPFHLQEFDCALTREVVDLIDREADLLNRGRSEKSLEGLRKRISNLFLQFIETPEFNPEAARFQKVPRGLETRPNVKPIINERGGATLT